VRRPSDRRLEGPTRFGGEGERADPEGLCGAAHRFGGGRRREARASPSLRRRNRAVRGEDVRLSLAFGRDDSRTTGFGSRAGCERHPPRATRSSRARRRACSSPRSVSRHRHLRVTGPVPDAQHATRVDGDLAPRTTPSAGPGTGRRRLATAVILCSGAEGQGRQPEPLLAATRANRQPETLRAESQVNIWGPTAKREG
jgi:hypothetical protein